MGRSISDDSESRFLAYVEGLVEVIGHADRADPLQDYCLGLLTAVDRKSVEPMAAITAPARVSAQHQSLLHFVGQAPWSDERVLAKVREMVLPAIERNGPIEAWIIDDTSFPKQGRKSVGVARQYCGQLGKQDNCQVAVTLSVANHAASLPVAYRLYLPEEWVADPARREEAHVPDDVGFATKPEIALAQIRAAADAGIPRGVVLVDAAYGANSWFRSEITALELPYVAGILPQTTVWPAASDALPAQPQSKRVQPPSRTRRGAGPRPVSVKALARALPASAWETVTWREGSADWLRSRFARLRVRAAHRDKRLKEPRPEEWLLIEWPEDEEEPTKYWLATLPEDIAFSALVDITKLRWRIERDYQELKQEVGLGHYEGRGWRGFHHHATLCIAAYGFLISERETIPPSGPHSAPKLQKPAVPDGYRPRGAANPARAAHPELDHHHGSPSRNRPRQEAATMSLLPRSAQTSAQNSTQSSARTGAGANTLLTQ